MDVWAAKDPRYEKAVTLLNQVGQKGAEPENLVESVLQVSGVKTQLTIFSATMMPSTSQKIDIYKTSMSGSE
jgi:hypothetical protein